ncbi:MAG: VOC family protein [Sphingobium limneticum]
MSRPEVSAGLYQVAFVVADIEAAMQDFTDRTGAGPWFFLKDFKPYSQSYRGEPCLGESSVAFAQAGSLQIELIMPRNGEPSPFREHIETNGYGLHHFGYLTSDFAADLAKRLNDGEAIIFEGQTSAEGGRVAVLDAGGGISPLVELIELSAAKDFFRMIAAAAEDWNGENPIRQLPG